MPSRRSGCSGTRAGRSSRLVQEEQGERNSNWYRSVITRVDSRNQPRTHRNQMGEFSRKGEEYTAAHTAAAFNENRGYGPVHLCAACKRGPTKWGPEAKRRRRCLQLP